MTSIIKVIKSTFSYTQNWLSIALDFLQGTILIKFMMQDEYSQHFKRTMYNKIIPSQILFKNYLRPIEIMLRTHKIDGSCAQGRRTSLPQGIMIASKQYMSDDSYTPITLSFQEGVRFRHQNKVLSAQHRKNFLNLLKEVNQNPNPQQQNQNELSMGNSRSDLFQNIAQGLQIAICVCIYSEDALMLQETINGIKVNVIELVKSGVNQDSIGVFVFFDGIEKIHPSIIEFFNKLQNTVLNINSTNMSSFAFRDYQQRQVRQQGPQQISPEEAEKKFFQRHTSRIIFSEDQLRDRQERSFQRVYQEYMSIVKLKQQIKSLKQDSDISYSKLPSKIQEEFVNLAKKKYSQKFVIIDQILFDLVYNKKQEEKALCMNALIQTETFCNKFLSTRSNLSYLFMHRELICNRQRMEEEQRRREMRMGQNRDDRYVFIPFPVNQEEQRRNELRDELNEIHLNLFFNVKYKNEGKLSSHNWFFNGFCKELNPKFVILMDVGLKAKDRAIFSMYHHLKANPKVGGVCGYMSLKIERVEREDEVQAEEVDCLTNICHKVVDIQRAQQVEYHFAHLLDKPFESLFRFIHVLPGAFSGYNMKAIRSPEDKDELILRKYFESLGEKIVENRIVESELTLGWMVAKVLLPDFVNSFFLPTHPDSEEQLLCNENMNLAEDRILCFGIHKNGFDLAYLPDAYSEVDPIKNLHSMFGQRKRWINGSYFAFEKVKEELAEFERSRGTCEFFLKLQMLYLSLVNAVSYFSVSLFLFTVHISMRAFYSDVLTYVFREALLTDNVIPFFINTMDFIYVFFVLSLVYCSLNLTYSNKRFKELIYIGSTVLGIFSIIVMVVLVHDLVSTGFSSDDSFLQRNGIDQTQRIDNKAITSALRYIIIGMIGLHAIPVVLYSLMYRKFQIVVEMVLGVASFLFYNPTYLITLNTYALCRMDDISWGTKGRDEEQKNQAKLKQKWKKLKFVHVFKFLFWNISLSFALLSIEYLYFYRLIITMVIMALISMILLLKLLLGFIYTIIYKASSRQVPIAQRIDDFRFPSTITNQLRQNKSGELQFYSISKNIETFITNSRRTTIHIQDEKI